MDKPNSKSVTKSTSSSSKQNMLDETSSSLDETTTSLTEEDDGSDCISIKEKQPSPVVRFAPEDKFQVIQIPHRLDFTPRERFMYWISDEEFHLAREGTKTIVAKMNKQQLENKRNYIRLYTRGLETQTKNGQATKRMAVAGSVCAVLIEQGRQKFTGIVDPEIIREKSMERSLPHVQAAIQRGDEDYLASIQPDPLWKALPTSLVQGQRITRRRISRILFGNDKGRKEKGAE